ncbi:NAD(P)H-dependent flavin oxidoreductase [Rhodoligotrophos defluvii]|uniref:NAD(P)H-dependent flavin oxidoreductase n=1 Tax=Rhodoligotrophos defluvii TaxID=2561934 RepID=UPI0010C9EFD1|nr:nitronate monooxygenase family protein [Rhodoligotrophos defluvii]
MPLPHALEGRLKAPIIAAPMFLTSGPDLVVATCQSGLIGTFPALNQRTSEGYEAWLEEIGSRLADAPHAAPYGVNLVVHRTNPRLQADLELTVKHKVPLVITSLGAANEVVEAIHSYGGIIFHDVISLRHAEKAAAAGVDGLIAVCAGAGGHAGTLSPFAFIPELRAMFEGTIILGGCISTGRQVAAARLLGADLAYIGTRFIATQESTAPLGHKQMIVEGRANDIVYTPAVSGVHGNFLRNSLLAHGIDEAAMASPAKLDFGTEGEAKAWKTLWSAGQGIGSIHDVPPAAELCARLIAEYHEALRVPEAA